MTTPVTVKVLHIGRAAREEQWFLPEYDSFRDAPLTMSIDFIKHYYWPDVSTPEDAISKIKREDAYLQSLYIIDIPYTDQGTKYFGFTQPTYIYSSRFPIIQIASEKIKGLFPIFTDWFAQQVLRHELGHLFGLKHHLDPFCLMCAPNISFGHYCKFCTKFCKDNPFNVDQ